MHITTKTTPVDKLSVQLLFSLVHELLDGRTELREVAGVLHRRLAIELRGKGREVLLLEGVLLL